MHPYFIVDDSESEYDGQIATIILRSTVGNNLAVYECRMDDGERVGFLAYQMGQSFLLRSVAEKALAHDSPQYDCKGVHCKCMNIDKRCHNYHNGDHTCSTSVKTEGEIKPVYTNNYDQPVYSVNNAFIRKNRNGFYELQLNNQYFEITAEMLKHLSDATSMPDTMGLSIG